MRPAGDGTLGRWNAGVADADLRIEFGSAFRQLGGVDRLPLPDIAGADGMDHDVAQHDRRSHLGEQQV